MIRLDKSAAIKRKIRRDDAPDLAIPTWTLLRQTIKAGETEEAFDLLDYELSRVQAGHDSFMTLMDMLLSNIRDVDITEAITELNRQENAYQAVLGATAKLLQPNLLDFLG